MTPCALVWRQPHLMDFDNLNNFHPISNLPFLAKVFEQTVASHLLSYIFFPNYILNHFNLNSLNLIKMASNSGLLSILILLDLNAAFDSIDDSLWSF